MSFDGDTPEDPHDIAVDWILRQKEGPLTRKEQAALDAWLAADAAHVAAFREAEGLSAEFSKLNVRAPAKQPLAKRRKRPFSAAAACAAALAFIFFRGDLSTFFRSDYSTGAGETRRVTLADGSRVELGARSAITLHFSPASRRLDLLSGEAWFDVAPDASRPFVVEAAGGTATALGTSFNVAVDDDGAHVTVTEHRVAVASGGKEVVAQEGQETSFLRGSSASAPTAANVAKLTAWRRGRLIVEDEALGDVLAALGRYRHGFVYCLRREICARRVTGVYRMDDPLQAIADIETALGLSAYRLSNYLILLHD
ncbi:FecR family protein [Methylosinus sp. LW4]|uniref:FecR family protein n=1 Tax=Methylosinus sp. LW4 TaxID=136993 RepID=UPI00036388D0|nr:FecR domain-containing protein [Methylosinus sp. LW4]